MGKGTKSSIVLTLWRPPGDLAAAPVDRPRVLWAYQPRRLGGRPSPPLVGQVRPYDVFCIAGLLGCVVVPTHRQSVGVFEVVSSQDSLVLPPLALPWEALAEGRGQRFNLGLGRLDGHPVAVVDGDGEKPAVPVGAAVMDVPWPG